MKATATLTALAILAALPAYAGSKIDRMCGPGHVNEALSTSDVTANPDGYYIHSLQTQISHGDERIVQAVGEVFHLCTRSAARPDMDTTKALLMMGERQVKYLFVPIHTPSGRVGS